MTTILFENLRLEIAYLSPGEIKGAIRQVESLLEDFHFRQADTSEILEGYTDFDIKEESASCCLLIVYLGNIHAHEKDVDKFTLKVHSKIRSIVKEKDRDDVNVTYRCNDDGRLIRKVLRKMVH